MTILINLLSRFWPYILIVGLVLLGLNWYGDQRYQDGYKAAEALYEKANADALAVKVEELRNQKVAYEAQITEAKKKSDDAQQAKEAAEASARKYRDKSDYYYSQWERLKDEIPTTGSDGPHFFTHGFVGLYNVAVRLPESNSSVHSETTGNINHRPEIGLSEVAEAAGLERGATAHDLAGPSQVDENDLLYNAKYNYRIANICIAERQMINAYFVKLCELGFCEQ